MTMPVYRPDACSNCGRFRVQTDGVCEKCNWDVDGGDYAMITRPNEYPRLLPENNPFELQGE